MPERSRGPRTFVDRGGTFTDVVIVEGDGALTMRKIPSDRAVVGELARGPVTFGTTVATNALLERAGVPTLLVVARGFADLVHIGDMSRPELFDPDASWPEPLTARVVEVDGRVDAQGREIEPLVLPELDLDGIDAVAIALPNSPRDPAHELAVAAHVRRVKPDVFVALGHRCSPELGYLARIETTLLDAAITPILRRSLARDRIPADALAMRSDGTVCPAADLAAPDAVLSGPAGGVVAVAAVAAQAGFARAIGLDMGGTSTDVCRVELGHLPRRDGDVRIAGIRLRRPVLEVETIAAGGGSILWNDGRALGVGPHSAGADPGPQCYGRGGPPTLTDAALVAGLIDADAFDPPLDRAQVRLPGASADDFLAIARDEMAAAIRRIATARGIDLADHALVAFGGAGGQHAADVAERLGIETVLVHPCASVLCAWGQALAPRGESDVRPIWAPLDRWDRVLAAWDELERALRPRLPSAAPIVERTVELRHRGTDHAFELAATSADEARAAFVVLHRARFGFDREGELEVVNARVRVREPAPPPPRIEADPFGLGDRRVDGPALLTSPTTSVVVPPGWRARLDRGLLRLDHAHRAVTPPSTVRTPYRVALWGNRFMGVAEEAGDVLRRLARSVNIRERLDFSCAVFDRDGQLVANAPHVPVHLGAMGVTVRDLLARHPEPEPGQAWLCNDPDAGGSHLPDLTVVTAVRPPGARGDHRWFVACRGHHADVGGRTPGSMPPDSRRIEDEGFVVRHVPLLEAGRLRDVRPLLVGCRDVGLVLADLDAQVASNRHAAERLVALGDPDVIDAWMAHLQDVAAEAVEDVVRGLPAETDVATDHIGGVPLALRLRRDAHGLEVDLTGTGGPHPGNLNAPPAVVRAAVLYALRLLVGRPIPLNEGALRRVRITAPPGSIVSPPPGVAVAGGNVETSQGIVDLVLRAAGDRAASQGTMNNLTIGGDGWSSYETIGGGLGASARGPGRSARQVHMTNTRATDPEVLEARLPLRVRAFAIRRGSGGDGRYRGGDGLIREIEVLAPATAALLATRRHHGAPGLEGGGPGLPAVDTIRREGRWSAWDGASVTLAPGDRVRIETPGGGGYGSPR